MRLYIASLCAFAGIIAGRLASKDHDEVLWEEAAEDSIHAGRWFLKVWKRKGMGR